MKFTAVQRGRYNTDTWFDACILDVSLKFDLMSVPLPWL